MKKVVIPRNEEIIKGIIETLEEETKLWLFIDEELLNIEKEKAGFYMTGFDGVVRLAYDGYGISVQYSREQKWHRILLVESEEICFSDCKDPEKIFFITTE